jgi:hypothetical protein
MKNKTSNKISKFLNYVFKPKHFWMFCFLLLSLPIKTLAENTTSESMEWITLKTNTDLNFMLLIFFVIIIFLYAYNTITKQ